MAKEKIGQIRKRIVRPK